MKKVLFLVLLAMPFVFTSCSDDDDDFSSSDIVGSWVLKKCTAVEVKTNNKEATAAIKEDIEGEYDDVVYTFESNGKLVIDDEEIGTYSLNGKVLKMTAFGETVERKISISGNTMTGDADETEYYQEEIEYLIDDADDVKVSEVITRYHYTEL